MEFSTRAMINASILETNQVQSTEQRIVKKAGMLTSYHDTSSSLLDDQRSSMLTKTLPDEMSMLTSTTLTKTVYCDPLRSRGTSMRQLYETAPSQRSLNPDSAWYSMDSVHSTRMIDSNDDEKNDSSLVSMNTSSSSFASFEESGDDDIATVAVASREFTQLAEAPTPRTFLLKQQSSRLRRGASYRGSSLALIDETMNLD
jgi:hypothetical protein